MKTKMPFLIPFCLLPLALSAAASGRSVIPFPPDLVAAAEPVPQEMMERVYEEVKTPYKHGVVIPAGEGEKVDCPNVFRHDGRWYMMFAVNKDLIGYETHLAVSDDLLNWERLGRILSFRDEGWDRWQADGGVSLIDYTWGGSYQLQKWEDRYWMTYIGGERQGYETDPLSIGVAWTDTPGAPREWTRYDGNPVLHIGQPDVRAFEEATLYKSHVIWDRERRLGYPFIMYYNGKDAAGSGHEAIGMAVSDDMRNWRRFGENWIVHNKGESRWAITGDPQITKIGDLWVMFYFGAFWKPDAFDTFACSHDMVNWTKWDGPHLVEPSEPWDRQFAHKPWILKHDGVVYHFYCAVGDQGRVIALATSRDLAEPATGGQP